MHFEAPKYQWRWVAPIGAASGSPVGEYVKKVPKTQKSWKATLGSPGFLLWLGQYIGEWRLLGAVVVKRRHDGLLEALSLETFLPVPLGSVLGKGELVKPDRSHLGPFVVYPSDGLMKLWLKPDEMGNLSADRGTETGRAKVLETMERRIEEIPKPERDAKRLDFWTQMTPFMPSLSPGDKRAHRTLLREYAESTHESPYLPPESVERFRLLFERTNVSQKKFAVTTGIHPSAVSGIFGGRRSMTWHILNKIDASMGDATAQWLLTGGTDMAETMPKKPSFSIGYGDDAVRYLCSTDPSAESWRVFVCGEDGSEVTATPVEVGEWMSPYHRIKQGEKAWIVDSYLLPEGARPLEVRIYIPDQEQPIRIEHPQRNHILWDPGARPKPPK